MHGYFALLIIRIVVVQVCSGDVTALAEISAELLGEGLCEGAMNNADLVVEAVENVVSAYGGIKKFRKNVNNFAQFSASCFILLALLLLCVCECVRVCLCHMVSSCLQ